MKVFYWARVVYPSPQGDKCETVNLPSLGHLQAFKAAIAKRGYKVAAFGLDHILTPQEAVNAVALAITQANPDVA